MEDGQAIAVSTQQEENTITDFMYTVVGTLAAKRGYPWSQRRDKVWLTAGRALEAIKGTFPDAVVDVYHGMLRLKLGKHDADERFNPAPDWLMSDGTGYLYPRSA